MKQQTRDEDKLWQEYQSSRDLGLRNRLINRYLQYAFSLAHKKKVTVPHFIDVEDLESAAVFGLIQSIERYDPSRGESSFETFSWRRINGAIQDWLTLCGTRFVGLSAEPAIIEPNPTMALENKESFTSILRRFCANDRDRTVFKLYYQEGHSMLQVGRDCGISESRVCQVLKYCFRRASTSGNPKNNASALAAVKNGSKATCS